MKMDLAKRTQTQNAGEVSSLQWFFSQSVELMTIRFGCTALDQCYWNKENWFANWKSTKNFSDLYILASTMPLILECFIKIKKPIWNILRTDKNNNFKFTIKFIITLDRSYVGYLVFGHWSFKSVLMYFNGPICLIKLLFKMGLFTV
jgi:hypothetical protein